METSVLTSKGQLLIPKRLRDKYGIKAGMKVAFIETGNGLMLKAMDEAYFDQFAGILKDAAPTTAEYKAWKKEDQAKEEKRTGKMFSSPAKRK
jgi:AbrB family looped-hinge helix DNA binding protein